MRRPSQEHTQTDTLVQPWYIYTYPHRHTHTHIYRHTHTHTLQHHNLSLIPSGRLDLIKDPGGQGSLVKWAQRTTHLAPFDWSWGTLNAVAVHYGYP